MKCDWDLFLDILNEAINSNVNAPMFFSDGAVYGGNSYTPPRINDRYEFETILVSILCIRDYSLADVRILTNRAAVIVERITPKGHTFTDKVLILKTIKQGISSESAIADNLGLKQHTVNYYIEQFQESGFIKANKSFIQIETQGEPEYIDCILTSKGRVALDDLSLLLNESSKSSNEVNQNYYAPVYGVAGNVQGNQNIYTSEQNQAHSKLEEMQQAEKQQQKILILSAIPHGLRLDKEIREIEEAIRRATRRDSFDIRIRTAVRPQDIRRAIAEEQPNVVHFCGHGLENGYLLLEDDGGNNKPVAPQALASLFKLHADYVKCVLLNACYSEKPAEVISEYINYVIGMNNPIQDKAAIEFAKGFYDGLGYEISDNQDIFQRAFDEGLVAAQLENISQEQIPVFKKKVIVEPNPFYTPLSEIPVTGNEASEVGADYTKLRELLDNKKFGLADLETASKILWVVRRDSCGWLDVEDIENFPLIDLRTINQLWLAASKGKFGFSVQRQIWRELGGQGHIGYDSHNSMAIFDSFIEKVGWTQNNAICFEARAAKGHLPLGMYVTVDGDIERIHYRWWVETEKTRIKELEMVERERDATKMELEELKKRNYIEQERSFNLDSGEFTQYKYRRYRFFLAREDF